MVGECLDRPHARHAASPCAMTSSPETSFSRSASLLSLRIGFELFESGPARDHLARPGGAEPAAWRHLPPGSWGYVSLTKLALHQFNPSIRFRMCLSPLALHVL